jgi:cobalt-zinc-cadmium efflux system outer membrane protein
MRLAVAFMVVIACARALAHADVSVPPATDLPSLLSLRDALEIFRHRGLDLLIADAATESAEGGVVAAGAVPNPTVSASVGNAFTYSTSAFSHADCLRNGAVCSPWAFNLGIADSAAISDTLSGKRDLRLKVARNALAAAKLSRADAERTLVFQVKASYAQAAQATLTFKFAKDIAATQATTLRKFRDRWSKGAIDEGDLQRVEVQKLEADQAVDTAWQALRETRVALAFLLGVRGAVPDFEVDATVLEYAVPAALRDATESDLLRTAYAHRPDLVAMGYERQQADAQLELTIRQQIPDVTLGLDYAWGGSGGVSTNGPMQGQELTFSLSFPLPVFYNLEGERRQAKAQVATSSLKEAKGAAQVGNDVAAAYAAFVAARRLVERMEGPRREGGGLLTSARGAFIAVEAQYDKGAARLTDYLDALRTYIATKNEYFGDLTDYWLAIFQLEAAVGRDLR